MINEHGTESYHLHNHRCEDLKSYEYGAVGEVRIDRGNRNTGRKYAPMPLCPRLIPYDLKWNLRWRRGGFAFILTPIIIFRASIYQSRLTDVSHREHWLYKYICKQDYICIFAVPRSCFVPYTQKLPTRSLYRIYSLAACLAKTTHNSVLWILIIMTQISVATVFWM
jgi:hypothetical protein